MGGRKRKRGDIPKGDSAQADLLQVQQRDRRLQEVLPSEISKIKASIQQVLHCATNFLCDLFSPFTSAGFTQQHLHERRANRSYRCLLLHLRSLSGFFDILCNHTAERSSISCIDSSQNEAEEILKHQVKHLEEKVVAKSDEVQRLESHAAAWITERESYARLVQEYKAELACLSERVEVYQEQNKVLQAKMERAEILQAQKSLIDSGSYEDCTATPPLLQAAADSVKAAIAMCASDLFSTSKKHSISLRASELGFHDDPQAVPIGVYITKVALQALLCQVFFKGFEDPYFFMDCRSWPPFEKPEKRRQRMFQLYKKLRDCKPEQMWRHNAEFNQFLKARMPALCDRLCNLLFKSNLNPNQLHEFIVSEFLNTPGSLVWTSMLRLLKAVWLLQKLAFAMEPTAQIFRVAQSSSFDEEFMEDLAPVDESEFDDVDDDCKTVTGANHTKKVNFMCVPGFTVRHTIIKARVVCLKDC